MVAAALCGLTLPADRLERSRIVLGCDSNPAHRHHNSHLPLLSIGFGPATTRIRVRPGVGSTAPTDGSWWTDRMWSDSSSDRRSRRSRRRSLQSPTSCSSGGTTCSRTRRSGRHANRSGRARGCWRPRRPRCFSVQGAAPGWSGAVVAGLRQATGARAVTLGKPSPIALREMCRALGVKPGRRSLSATTSTSRSRWRAGQVPARRSFSLASGPKQRRWRARPRDAPTPSSQT